MGNILHRMIDNQAPEPTLGEVSEELVKTLCHDLNRVLWKIARTTHIPGYDPEDLMQEMKIKIWEVVRDNKYDPERVQPSTFFYRVCKNYLMDLHKSRIYKYKTTLPKNREFKDALDTTGEILEQEMLNIGGLSPNFVRNFSENFVTDFFRLVLLDEELQELFGAPNEEVGDNQVPDSLGNTQHQEQV